MFTHSDNRPEAIPTRSAYPLSRCATDAGTWDQVKTLSEAVDASGCQLAQRALCEGLSFLRDGRDFQARMAFSYAEFYARTAG